MWPLLALALFFSLAAPGIASNPLDSALAAELALIDCRLTVLARQALLQDDQLAPLNLGVSVHDRSAVLWGSATSVELARLALEKVRLVQGIHQVDNQVVVETPDDPLLDYFKTPQPPRGAPPADKPPRAGSLTGREAKTADRAGTSIPFMPVIAVPAPLNPASGGR